MRLDKARIDFREDFEEFCGQWSDAEAEAFNQTVAAFNAIDDEVWQ